VTLMKKSTRKALARYWGYIFLPVIFYGWFVGDIGYGPLAIASVLASSFFLLQARVPCCADNRKVLTATGEPTLCRNNSRGLLRGCHIIAHRWQNLRMIGRRHLWGRLFGGLFRRVSGAAATFSALAGMTSALIASGALLVATLNLLKK
jgi:hypothetical protein